ncbi:DUF1398 domain-containing protein [Thiomonas intermedia]|uniref:DUF1398 domain-containing protein n=1 Tax=Thiomonas intermedia TaxID=926 RepID=UPI0009A4D2E1|nr:DUF1398 family protein [Thiomonas intermedia]
MNEQARTVIQATFDASNQGTIAFGEVIRQLTGVEVESYHVDYRAGRATYVLPEGDPLDLAFERPARPIAPALDGDALRNTILAAQQGKVMYPEFKRLSQAAGCIGYTVWLAGRQVTYYGRKGETHIERFPD